MAAGRKPLEFVFFDFCLQFAAIASSDRRQANCYNPREIRKGRDLLCKICCDA